MKINTRTIALDAFSAESDGRKILISTYRNNIRVLVTDGAHAESSELTFSELFESAVQLTKDYHHAPLTPAQCAAMVGRGVNPAV